AHVFDPLIRLAVRRLPSQENRRRLLGRLQSAKRSSTRAFNRRARSCVMRLTSRNSGASSALNAITRSQSARNSFFFSSLGPGGSTGSDAASFTQTDSAHER